MGVKNRESPGQEFQWGDHRRGNAIKSLPDTFYHYLLPPGSKPGPRLALVSVARLETPVLFPMLAPGWAGGEWLSSACSFILCHYDRIDDLSLGDVRVDE